MMYEEFREKFDYCFVADLEDEDVDGETIIRPNVEVSIPKEEAIKRFFDIMIKTGLDLKELYNISEEVIVEFNTGLKLKLTPLN